MACGCNKNKRRAVTAAGTPSYTVVLPDGTTEPAGTLIQAEARAREVGGTVRTG